MKILLASLDAPGHNLPIRKIIHELAAHGHKVDWLSLRDISLKPGSFDEWAQRLLVIGPRWRRQIRSSIEGNDLLLTDPTVLNAPEIAQEFNVPWAQLGIMPLWWLPPSCRCIIQFTNPSLELFPPSKSLQFAGPIKYTHQLPQPKADRIHITQGTLANDRDDLINPAARELDRHGFTITVDPPYPIASHNYYSIFLEISLLITNGGYGAVNQALALGIPVVVAGATEEKHLIGERVRKAGVGIYLEKQRPSPREILSAVKEVKEDLAYTFRARRFAADSLGHAPKNARLILEEFAEHRRAA